MAVAVTVKTKVKIVKYASAYKTAKRRGTERKPS